jgi:hypothetical protein
LELNKCSFHQIHYDFRSNGTPLMRPGPFGKPLTVRNNVGQLVTIPAKSVFDSHQTLGHHKAPAGDSN